LRLLHAEAACSLLSFACSSAGWEERNNDREHTLSSHTNNPEQKRRRGAPLVWGSAAVAAAILVLGVTGTLSTWTDAIINNTKNTVAAQDTLVLQETGPGAVVCNSTDNLDGTNSYDCTTINKYGGIAAPLDQGTSQTVTVTMKNTGTGSGTLTLAPGTCTKTLGSPDASLSICDVATVTIVCTAPSTLDTSATPVVLSAFAGQTIGTLAADTSTDCTFTVALPSDASPQIGGQVATQSLVWTLA
jgi:hypothetical protein